MEITIVTAMPSMLWLRVMSHVMVNANMILQRSCRLEHRSDFDLIKDYIEGLEQHCSNSIANALELLQSCTKPSISSYACAVMRPHCTHILFFGLTCFIIKSPQYTGGDFMFLYRFVRRRRRRHRRRRPQILVHAITFEQLIGFLSFLAQLLALTCRLPD